jgi:IrrE N-terminal-like domain
LNDLEIENLAGYVLSTYRLKVPVDLERICAEEGVLLAPGQYSPSFHGRIEFIPEHKVFVIYYPESSRDQYPSRVRFSLSHELGHYFIEEHRRIIQEQRVHNSIGPFRSVSDRIENEADKFASALLIPAFAVEAAADTRGFLDLAAILKLAEQCQASAQATAFRYVQLAEEPCLAVVSRHCKILYSFSCDEADDRGFKWLGNRDVPEQSQARKCDVSQPSIVCANHSHTTNWFTERRAAAKLWEESVMLGKSGYVLTLLSWPDYKPE